ncbi:MAG: hypothetical protein ACLT16_20630 [[Clostridium] innocuum]
MHTALWSIAPSLRYYLHSSPLINCLDKEAYTGYNAVAPTSLNSGSSMEKVLFYQAL